MFEPAHESWSRFQAKIGSLCTSAGYTVKADIANYFERIPQHHLVNLMSAAKCPSEVVNLLEKMLLAFQERDLFGIIQGVFPSDVLGNFFRSEFDGYCDIHEIPSVRYVDDMYLCYASEVDAQRGLIELIERLRKDGLHLNEYKSGIRTTHEVLREETEVDVLFEEARAIAALFAAKHGSPTQKRTVRLAYESEPSVFVRSAILYASRYFTRAERKTCKKAWGAPNLVNALISQAL